MLHLSFVVVFCGAVAGCTAGAGAPSAPSLVRQEILGKWSGAHGRTATFSESGGVTLSGVPCEEVFVEGKGAGMIEGSWKIVQRLPDDVSGIWIDMEFSAGTCGNQGRSESGFYPYEKSGDLVLHLGDPDISDRRLDFFKDSTP